MRYQKKKVGKKLAGLSVRAALILLLAGFWAVPVRAAEPEYLSEVIQMPGFKLEQWDRTRPMAVTLANEVRILPDPGAQSLGTVTAGQFIDSWGQTDTGWYFIAYNGMVGYVRYEAAAFLTAAQQEALALQEAIATEQLLGGKQPSRTAEQPQPVAEAQQAGVVFIGDSRMVTLRESVERKLGFCPVTVVAKSGGRYEWFHDTGASQADKVIGSGTKVLINMGVNDLSNAKSYATDVNAWAAAWIARGATVYYASVNPVWTNIYGKTEEQVSLFNSTLKGLLIPQIVWLDSNTYLKQHGFSSNDGLHYLDDTNLLLYQYYLTMLGMV